MRLICPNCDAEYEVDASVIPEGGRDVQCSNCGHFWFQLPDGAELAAFDPTPEAEAYGVAAAVQETVVTSAETGASPAVAADATDFSDGDTAIDALEAELAALEAEAPPVRPRQLDADLLAVLREEAEREVAQRRQEAPPEVFETQEELALTTATPVPPPAPTAAHLAAAAAGPVPASAAESTDSAPLLAAEAEAQRGKGRELFPDIEEINSTLRPAADPRDGAVLPGLAADTAASAAAGFRAGFLLPLVLAAALVAVYASAPQLATRLPALAPTLTSFVGTVDQGRIWLDGLMKSAVDAIDGKKTAG